MRELRAEGKAEASIATIARAASRTFAFARRRMHWHGQSPFSDLENGERPRLSEAAPRRIFQGEELQQTLAAAREPYRTLFSLAAVTGARKSELLGLTWGDVDLSDPSEASVRFEAQADREGRRVPLKTAESRRTVELPRSLAGLLLAHRARSLHCQEGDFLFCTRSGRAIGQRNVLRELRRAMKAAVDHKGRPTFEVMHRRDENGKPQPVPRGSVPSFHGFRHTAASDAIAAGDGVEEVAWQLGHRNSNVTRAVYVHEVKSAERTARRRAKMEDRYGSLLDGGRSSQARVRCA